MTSAIVFGMVAAAVSLLALILVQRAAGFTRRNGPIAAAFAGGLVITIAVTHLIPEALIMAPNAPWLVLGGFAFGFVVHTLLGGAGHNHHGGETPAPNRIAALAPVIAIAMHSALDGLIYSVTFAVDSAAGLIAATGLIIHEFPEALICFVLLQRTGLRDGRAAVYAFLASGATTFIAAAISAPFASALDPQTLGVLFALVAGLLLHVGAAHLIHEAAEAGALRGGGAVFAGAGVAVLMALGHSHNHGPDDGHDRTHDGHHHHDPAEIHTEHDADHDHGHDHDHDHGHDHPHF